MPAGANQGGTKDEQFPISKVIDGPKNAFGAVDSFRNLLEVCEVEDASGPLPKAFPVGQRNKAGLPSDPMKWRLVQRCHFFGPTNRERLF